MYLDLPRRTTLSAARKKFSRPRHRLPVARRAGASVGGLRRFVVDARKAEAYKAPSMRCSRVDHLLLGRIRPASAEAAGKSRWRFTEPLSDGRF